MKRVTIIHCSSPDAERIESKLCDAGYSVRVVPLQGAAVAKRLAAAPADAIVIDLSRAPSHGQEVATWLRGRKSTRGVPLVFTGGESAKVGAVRRLLPDAVYTGVSGIKGAVHRAIARPPATPVVPDPMAGYSKTPLPKKLGIKPGSSVVLVGAPPGFEERLGDLPRGARVGRRLRSNVDLVLLFAGSRADLGRRFAKVAAALAPRGGVWIAWRKKISGVATDLTQTTVREYGLDRGFVDYKICAIDEIWSGLRFTRRQSPRATR